MDSNGSTICNTKFQQTFGGVQIGQDIGKLNINGWNVHLGTTAGVIGTQGQIIGGNTPAGGAFNTTTEAPFIGTYLVATQGNFFIDGLVRFDYYQTKLDSPTINVFNQDLDAYGYSASASGGYHWDVPNSKWFIEPSVGMIWTDAKVNPLQSVGQSVVLGAPGLIQNFQGTTNISDLTSLVGRAGLRIGTSFEVGELALQPFAAASVWHEFEGGFTATYSSCPNCIFQGGGPGTASNLSATMSGQGIGTFGQYSVGVAGQLKGTGWLGFARLDYRDGEHLEGLSGTGGIRYQFTPTAVATMPVKARPIEAPINWSGFYVGVIGGTDYGHGSLTFAGVSSADVRPAGVFGGGEVGYNVQAANWVYGLEGDLAGVGAEFELGLCAAQCGTCYQYPIVQHELPRQLQLGGDHRRPARTAAHSACLDLRQGWWRVRGREGCHHLQPRLVERDLGVRARAELRESGGNSDQRGERESRPRRMDGGLRFGVRVHAKLDGQGRGRLARLR